MCQMYPLVRGSDFGLCCLGITSPHHAPFKKRYRLVEDRVEEAMKQLDHTIELEEVSEAATPFMGGSGSGSPEDFLARIEHLVGAAKASKLGEEALRGEMVLAHLRQDFDEDLDYPQP